MSFSCNIMVFFGNFLIYKNLHKYWTIQFRGTSTIKSVCFDFGWGYMGSSVKWKPVKGSKYPSTGIDVIKVNIFWEGHTILRNFHRKFVLCNNRQPILYQVSSMTCTKTISCFKVHIFWKGHKILRNLHLTFVLCSTSQK